MFGDTLLSSFATSSGKFNKFGASNLIIFQVKVFGKNIKGTTPVKYFIKVTACLSFMRLKPII